MKRIEITSAGCPKTYHQPTDNVVAPCEYGTRTIIQLHTQEDIDGEVEKAITAYEAALGEPADEKDRARLKVDVLARLGYPTLWTKELERQIVKDVQASHEKVMKAHSRASFKVHPHANEGSAEHRRAAKPARKASVSVTDVPLGTDVRPPESRPKRSQSN